MNELTQEQQLRIKAMELALSKFDGYNKDIINVAEEIFKFLIKSI